MSLRIERLTCRIGRTEILPGVTGLHARPGDGSINSHGEFDTVLKSIRAVLGEEALRRLHIHISGIEYGPKGEKKHLPFEDADLRYLDFLQALADNGCAGRLLCESPIMEEDALMIQRAWHEIH